MKESINSIGPNFYYGRIIRKNGKMVLPEQSETCFEIGRLDSHRRIINKMEFRN